MIQMDLIAQALREDVERTKSLEIPGPVLNGIIIGLERAIAIVEGMNHD